MTVLETIYITVLGSSFIVSLISFRWNFPFHLKFFSLLLGLTFLVELCAIPIFRTFSLGTNSQVYTPFMLVEFCAYTFYYRQILKNRNLLTSLLLLVVVLTWLISTIFIFGFFKWNSYISITGCCCTIILAVCYYGQLLRSSEPVKLLRQPEFFIATGMLIFYSCQLPFLGALNYLVNNHYELARSLLRVLQILNIVMYSLFTFAFLCNLTPKKL